MDEKQKQVVGAVAGKVAAKANEQAKTATGWKKWAWIALAAAAGAAAWFTLAGCKTITPVQVRQAHKVYHAATGKPCVFKGK